MHTLLGKTGMATRASPTKIRRAGPCGRAEILAGRQSTNLRND